MTIICRVVGQAYQGHFEELTGKAYMYSAKGRLEDDLRGLKRLSSRENAIAESLKLHAEPGFLVDLQHMMDCLRRGTRPD